jgi:hypothetical protein
MPPTPTRFFTLEEANAKVANLEKQFAVIEGRLERARTLQDQVNDLEIVWGARLLTPECPERDDYERFRAELASEQAGVDEALRAIAREGIEVKDPFTGLVDFYAKRGEETVLLCWRKGEREVGFWHTLTGGFAGRKPMNEF